jgi:CRISPR-associated endonuclease/helicase Cas3
MRPFHAGLLGADTLVVLDEAHLVPPFEALLRRIESGTNEFGPRANANDHHELVPPFRLVSLSATGRAQSTSHGSTEDGSFHLEGEDISDPVVIRRLAARKTLEFVKISDAKDALADALTEQAWMALAKNDRPIRCLVYCDSREIAEKVKENLDKLAAPDKKASQAKADTELFVGARRVKEREDAKTWLQRHGFLAGSSLPAKPAFLIATSASISMPITWFAISCLGNAWCSALAVSTAVAKVMQRSLSFMAMSQSRRSPMSRRSRNGGRSSDFARARYLKSFRTPATERTRARARCAS